MATLSDDARVSATAVKDIIDTDLTVGQINAFINAANLVVTTQLASAGLGETLLTEIEKWLTAHLLSTRDQRTESESVGGGGGYSVRFQGKTSMGLDATIYGQQVKLLDTSGTLARLGLKTARLNVISLDDILTDPTT